jgi:hypothetical protein
MTRRSGRIGCVGGCLIIVLCGLFMLAGLSRTGRQAVPARGGVGLRPEVASFLAAHPEFGRPVATRDVPDWAQGPRQRVAFEDGRDLLFYMKGGRVMTVYEDKPGVDIGRVKVWGEYATSGGDQ